MSKDKWSKADDLCRERNLFGLNDYARELEASVTEKVLLNNQLADFLGDAEIKIKELEAEIANCYKMNCGRDFMHLPLSEAVQASIKAAEVAECEACAVICENMDDEHDTAMDCMEFIRARREFK